MRTLSHPLPLLLVLLVLTQAGVLTGPAAGQALPEGKRHANRERSYDIHHLRADLEIDFARQEVAGSVAIELEPLRRIDTVTLDAILLQVEGAKIDGAPAEFRADGRQLHIATPGPREPGQTLEVEVGYRARPRAGMYFQTEPGGEGRYVVTYGEGGLHANWLPIYNDVNDRFSTEMRITVPAPYVVVSNGELLESVSEPDGRTTWHWKQERPHSNYLISIYAGDLERGELPAAFGSIPLAYWVPRGRKAEGAWGFRNTTRMVEFFSDLFDYRYPWVKYDQIAIVDYPIGAMEHTGVTGHDIGVIRLAGQAPDNFGPPTFDEYHTDWTAEATIAHELAHHWFGDNLTCRNLSQLWLNESFASYLMMLWAEESQGVEQLLFDVELARRHYLTYVAEEHQIRPLEYAFFDAPNDIYNEEHTYLKGAAILHMLRGILGDEPFFGAMAYYLDKHEFSNVESRDLKIAIEEAVGRNLDWFFGDWITGGGHPIFEVEYHWLEDRKQIDLSVRQVQAHVEGQDTFRLPVTIAIATPERTWRETLEVEGTGHNFLIPCDAEPEMVGFDPEGSLVAEIRFDKEHEELLYQARHDALIGRLRALGQLAERFPTRPTTLQVFHEILDDGHAFWGLRAEAAQLLGTLRTPEAELLAQKTLASQDYRVRKAAVLGLPGFGTASAKDLLRATIRRDPHNDVIAAAIVALAKADPGGDATFLAEQLDRDAWYDEIRLAVLTAIRELAPPDLLTVVRPYTGQAYNMALREAAFEAWVEIAPTDPALHAALLEAAQGPPYPLQKYALEELGELYVQDAVPLLEELVRIDVDPNLTKLAREALEEIRRIRG
jgi:aminopeptidase N